MGPQQSSVSRWMLLIWTCFLARGFFYCSFLPLWEGYDEWAHFSCIDRLVTSGKPLVDRDAPVSFEVAQSLRLAPVPWEMRSLPPPSLTHDEFWQLPARDRAERRRLIDALRPGGL